MTLRIKLHIFTLILFLFTAILASHVIGLNNAVLQANRRLNVMSGVVTGIFELDQLKNDYLLYQPERAREQWLQKQAGILSSLREPLLYSIGDPAILERMSSNLRELRVSFEQLATLPEGTDFVTSDIGKRLIGKLAVTSQDTVSLAHEASEIYRNSVNASLQMGFFIGFSLAFMMLAIALVTRSIIRRGLGRISGLTRVAGEISQGHLDAPIDPGLLASHDELGHLARTFSFMMQRLKSLYANLESQMVAIEEKVDEIQKMNRMMVGRELKMEDLKKEIAALKQKNPDA